MTSKEVFSYDSSKPIKVDISVELANTKPNYAKDISGRDLVTLHELVVTYGEAALVELLAGFLFQELEAAVEIHDLAARLTGYEDKEVPTEDANPIAVLRQVASVLYAAAEAVYRVYTRDEPDAETEVITYSNKFGATTNNTGLKTNFN